MTNFEKFKQKLEEDYEDINKFGAYLLDWEYENIPYKGEIVESNREDFDSYGKSVDINMVIYFKEFNIFVRFESEKQSFNGIIWNKMKEVKKKGIIITNYE